MKISRTKRAPVAAANARRRARVPEHVDAERHGDPVTQPPDDVRHRRGRRVVDPQLVRPVVLVAEHHRVEAGGLQGAQVGAGVGEDALDAPRLVVQRGPRQRAQVHHRDDRLAGAEDLGEPRHDVPPSTGER